ncbi:hypothetical protein [Foetidibacter luteolus]|uniref:hypothetical protein n=1 Tax=Foetidibacter luteolus TaxID=2608880 RepID=UPI00129BB923|nr:hypothetical protein [Foetidibacter luteolus]
MGKNSLLRLKLRLRHINGLINDRKKAGTSDVNAGIGKGSHGGGLAGIRLKCFFGKCKGRSKIATQSLPDSLQDYICA